MQDKKLAYIFPSRSRPDKFFACLENIQSLSAKENYIIICSLDVDDDSMNNELVLNRISEFKNVTYYLGNSTGKVNSINRELQNLPTDTDIIILMSDDMVFTQPGFDEIIRVDMQKYFPDLDGCLHYPDQSPVQDKIITMIIMGVNYFRRFNYLYHPEYKSLWCDLEQTECAKKLGKYKYLPNAKIFFHDHPVWKREKYDALMTRNEGFYNSDKEIYFKRLAKNFDL